MPAEDRLQRRLREAAEITDPGGKRMMEWAKAMHGKTFTLVSTPTRLSKLSVFCPHCDQEVTPLPYMEDQCPCCCAPLRR